MKFYSEKTKEFYESEAECVKAEKDFEEQIATKKKEEKRQATERKLRAKEVENAYETAKEAYRHYYDLLDKFIADYGYFHMSIDGDSLKSVDDNALGKYLTELLKFF
jgi:isopenicillin N synthase-like dioxygenase